MEQKILAAIATLAQTVADEIAGSSAHVQAHSAYSTIAQNAGQATTLREAHLALTESRATAINHNQFTAYIILDQYVGLVSTIHSAVTA